jgi:phosphoglycolate phosphatase-like HAD superfamily hydrolase
MATAVLWDIDGTLVWTAGAGLTAMRLAFKRTQGRSPDLSQVDVVGRTDLWILRRLLESNGIQPTAEVESAIFDAYVEAMPSQLAEHAGHVLPGVADLLRALAAEPNLEQGLLTGNLHRTARLKLEHYGLWHWFSFGAFGDDTELRAELGPLALAAAESQHGSVFPPQDAVVIGDTPHDISCGRALGARTIAVATGRYGADELAADDPTTLVADLVDTERLVTLIRAE